ncbi:peptidyl-prolyl cis-trans isomerase FKBP16-1, chloroplastic [Lactuca sativa]|uniref:peptidyl-prolyl cis-trans isomerase FKBP16-1, chloroplastic n=1 Tax=Lactuca sativa TaxID=4236 RepID=UPI000CD9D122|nr:peptidyl-prolyl cis-trans isomerase FKBP16-1, chloroplastic [Lactuca sativa]
MQPPHFSKQSRILGTMGSVPFQKLISAFNFQRLLRPGHVTQNSSGELGTSKMIPRRLVLHMIPLNFCLHAEALEMKEPEVIRSQKLDSGVRIQDIIDGEGEEAHEGDFVEVNYVCRRSNGYFVHSTVDQFSGETSPVVLPLNEKEIIKGLKEVIIGMKVGGKRRALIPPSVGYVNETLGPIPDEFGPRRSLLSHVKEPLIFEVQLLKVL